MSIKAMNGKREEVMVKMGMVDRSAINSPRYFLADIGNILPAIRKERSAFIEWWIKNNCLKRQLEIARQPEIAIFFDSPGGKRSFVLRDWCGEYVLEDNLILNQETMSRPDELIVECLKAYARSKKLWEDCCKEKKGEIEEPTIPARHIKPVPTLVSSKKE